MGWKAHVKPHSPAIVPAPPPPGHLPSAAMLLPGAWPAGSPGAGGAVPQGANIAGISSWGGGKRPCVHPDGHKHCDPFTARKKGRAMGLGQLLQGPAGTSTGQRGPALATAQASPSAQGPQPHPLHAIAYPSHLLSTWPLPLGALVSELQSSPGPGGGQSWVQQASPGHCIQSWTALLPGEGNRVTRG